MRATEQRLLAELVRTLEARAKSAAAEYETHPDQFRRAFCDGQAHAFGRAASDLRELVGAPVNAGLFREEADRVS